MYSISFIFGPKTRVGPVVGCLNIQDQDLFKQAEILSNVGATFYLCPLDGGLLSLSIKFFNELLAIELLDAKSDYHAQMTNLIEGAYEEFFDEPFHSS